MDGNRTVVLIPCRSTSITLKQQLAFYRINVAFTHLLRTFMEIVGFMKNLLTTRRHVPSIKKSNTWARNLQQSRKGVGESIYYKCFLHMQTEVFLTKTKQH